MKYRKLTLNDMKIENIERDAFLKVEDMFFNLISPFVHDDKTWEIYEGVFNNVYTQARNPIARQIREGLH